MKKNLKRRVKFEENEDRISSLPDCLVVEIVSRLKSTKQAIRTCTLSKRWKHVWTMIPTLNFTNRKENGVVSQTFFSLAVKTLNQCSNQFKLKKFKLHIRYDVRFNSQLYNWIHYAINRDVENLDLMLGTPSNKAEFVLDQFVFTSSCFTHLKLGSCIFNPIRAISWKNLKSLHISHMKLDEDLIANILSGSPLLETLNLKYCFGFRRVDITSKSVKKFRLDGFGYKYNDVDIFEINAPNILSLTIKGGLFLKRLFLLHVSSLVKAKIDYSRMWYRHPNEEAKVDKQMLKRLILSLRHVKELTIGTSCSRDLFYMEDKGFISPLKMKVFYYEYICGVQKLFLRDVTFSRRAILAVGDRVRHLSETTEVEDHLNSRVRKHNSPMF